MIALDIQRSAKWGI